MNNWLKNQLTVNFTHKRGVPWNFQCMIFHPLDNTVTRRKTNVCVFWTKRCVLCDKVFDWQHMQYRHYSKYYNCRAKQLGFSWGYGLLVLCLRRNFYNSLKCSFLFRTARQSQLPNLQNCHNGETKIMRLWFGSTQ